MDQIQAAVDTVLPATKFQIFSGILKASRSNDGKMRLSGVASSTVKDLHGDTIMASAIEEMEEAANKNMTIFLNHSYEVPEDVAGSVETAKMRTRGVDVLGDPLYDLDMSILINDTNPRAVKAFEAIEHGTKLGLSIGALIPEGGARKEKGGNYLIEHLDLLETSLVGIPANPRSWVEYAAKSLRGLEKDAVSVPLGEPTLTLDGASYKIEGTVDGIQFNNNTISSSSTIWSTTPLVETSDDTEPDVTAAQTCGNCGGTKGSPKGGCTNSFHKPDPDAPNTTHGLDPDVSDAQVTIIQIDTEDGSSSSDSSSADAPASQDGPGTNPDTEDGEHAASGDEAVEIIAEIAPGEVNALQRALDLLSETTGKLVTSEREIAALTASVSLANSERDAANAQRDMVLMETQRVLNRLADTPLMRKAVVLEAERDLRQKFSGIYTDDFLKMLETPK